MSLVARATAASDVGSGRSGARELTPLQLGGFRNAVRMLRDAGSSHIDVGLAIGALVDEDNATAAHWLLWAMNPKLIAQPDGYKVRAVSNAAKHIRDGTEVLVGIPVHVMANALAMKHARLFICACGDAGLEIDFSK